MKHVILKISLALNIVTLAFVGKFFSPLHNMVKSQFETKPTKTVEAVPKPDPAKAVLKESVFSQRTQIEGCYDDYLRREPDKKNGSIAVHWLIGSEGKVQSPTIADAEIDDSELKRCVLEQVSLMTFDPEKFGENMEFSYRFHFKARAPASVKFE